MLNMNFLIKSTLFLMIVTQVFLINSYSQSLTPGTAPGTPEGSLSLSNIDTANYFTGQVNLSVPVYSAPGRGEAQIPFSIELEQNKWYLAPTYDEGSHDYSYSAYRGEGTVGETISSETVFAVGNGTLTMDMKRLKSGSTECPWGESIMVRATKTLTLLYFVAPNGTRYEFRDKNSRGQVNASGACNYSGYSFNRGTVFTSVDGSAATFVSDQAIIDSHLIGDPGDMDPSGYLYLPNGSTYRFEQGAFKWLRDKNGNIVSAVPESELSGNYTYGYKDSLNRAILFAPYRATDPQWINTIKYKGFGGGDKYVYVYFDSLENALRSDQTLKNTKQLFPGLLGGWNDVSQPFNPAVISKIVLADNREYKLFYNSYGDIARIESPTGSIIEYDWKGALIGEADEGVTWGSRDQKMVIYRRIVERRTYLNNTTLVQKMVIGRLSNLPNTAITVDTFGATSSLINRVKYLYYGNPIADPYSDQLYASWKDGYNYETQFYGQDGTTLLGRQLTARENKLVPWLTYQDNEPRNDPRQTKQVTVTIENGQALAVLNKTEYDETGSYDPDYFSHLNVKRSKAYNNKLLDLNTAQNGNIDTIAGLFSESDLVSVAEKDYLYDAGYKARHILGLPSETRMMNPASPTQVLEKRQTVYDEQNQYYSMSDSGSTTGYEAPTGTYAYLRGNATTYKTWFAEENRWVETHTQYDNFGNMRKVWDLSGDQNRFVETEYSSQYYYAYPTKTINPAPDPTGTHGTTETSSVLTTYDFWTGKPVTITNPHGQVTSMEYDNLLRLKKVTPPTGMGIVEKEYGDTPGNFYIKVRQQVDAQNWAESTEFSDNLGRVYKTQTKDHQGDVITEIQYDDFGRVKQVSNPYRQGEQILWSKPRYDNAGRVVETYAPAPDGQTGASNGIVEFGISNVTGFIGNYTQSVDASGRKARSITDVFGQTIRVDEPTGNNDLGPLNNPNQPSFYIYNVKGELAKIQQGQQNRYFMYDSLGRLIRVRQLEQTPNSNLATTGNPENNQWTTGFTYDIFGNVITVTDAKNMVITSDYDKAGRTVKTVYTDGTPQIDFYYDGTGLGLSPLPQFAKGNLTRVSNGVSETRYTSFDNVGNLLASQQITDGQTYNFGYKYDNFGHMSEQTYPSMRVVKTLLNTDGSMKSVSSKTASSLFKSFASNFDYTAAGKTRSMMLGNGRWETAQFNTRAQLIQSGLGVSSTDTSLWKVNYDYGELNTDGSVDASKNIGNIAKQTITLPTTTFVQTYKYDELNRLKEAKETTGTVTGTENWKQTFGYDRYGNRTSFYQKVGNTVLPINSITLPQVDAATNRFTTGQGYVYDFNGNLVQDAENRSFTYNADNRQKEVRDLTIPTPPGNPDANVIGRYYYDGEGKRIKKVTNTEMTVFVYDAGGYLTAEYSTQLSQQPTTSYLTNDQLGSPRVITDRQGNVVSRRDFMPFGEEILAGVGGRDSVNQKYSASGIDNVRKRFTGYEKDDETQLDFAKARMYQNKHGRFTAPDPLLASASLGNPQTFNRYAYVGNNPTNFVDPNGLCGTTPGSPDDTPCRWYYNPELGYMSVSEKEFGDGSAYQGYTLVENPENVTLDNPVFSGTYAEVDKYKEIVARGLSAGLGSDGMFYGFGGDTTISDDEEEVSTDGADNLTAPDFDFGLGYLGRLDKFPSGETFEIHVYDKNLNEAGVVSGRFGWLEKHGFDGNPPPGLPRDVINKINGQNVAELRARGMIPGKGLGNIRGGSYLFAGRTMFGVTHVLSLAHGFFVDYEVYREGQKNGRSITEEYRQRWKDNDDQKYIDTVIGPLPNPCYQGACEVY